jgi:hypothetical protein
MWESLRGMKFVSNMAHFAVPNDDMRKGLSKMLELATSAFDILQV